MYSTLKFKIYVRNTYSIANKVEFDIIKSADKHKLYKQFVAWCCNGCFAASLTEYLNILIFYELLSENTYFSSSDTELCIDMTDRMGYMNKLDKLGWVNSNLTPQIYLKNAPSKK